MGKDESEQVFQGRARAWVWLEGAGMLEGEFKGTSMVPPNLLLAFLLRPFL